MKKKILAIVLSASMCLSLCPQGLTQSVWASEVSESVESENETKDGLLANVDDNTYENEDGILDAGDEQYAPEENMASDTEENPDDEQIMCASDEEEGSEGVAEGGSEAGSEVDPEDGTEGTEEEDATEDPEEEEMTEEERQALLKAYASLDLDLYRAKILTQDNDLYAVDNLLHMWSPAEMLISDLNRTPGFEEEMDTWKGATFDAGNLVDELSNEQSVCEAILLEMLEMGNESNEVIDQLQDDYGDNLMEGLSDALSLLSKEDKVIKVADMISAAEDIDASKLTSDQQMEILKKVVGTESDVLSEVKQVLDWSGNLYDCLCTIESYKTLKKYYGTTMYNTLQQLNNLCTSAAMKSAISEVSLLVKDEAGNAAVSAFTAYKTGAVTVTSTVLGEVWNKLLDASPLKYIHKAQSISKAIADKLFNATNICGQVYLLEAYQELITASRTLVTNTRSAFQNNQTSENASVFLDSLNLCMTGMINGCDYACDFADAVQDAAMGKVYTSTQTQCDKFKNQCATLKKLYQDKKSWMLDQEWRCYFADDYPDIWKALAGSQGFENWSDDKVLAESISVTSATSMTVKPDAPAFRIKAACSPSDATNQTYLFKSSNENVATVTGEGWVKAQNTTGKATITISLDNGPDENGNDRIVSTSIQVTVSNSLQCMVLDGVAYYLSDDTTAEDSKGNSQDGTAMVNCRNEDMESVEIPETVEYLDKTYVVNWIASLAYGTSKKLSTVVLPETVTKFSEGAFCKCPGLKTINIPKGVTEIPAKCFFETKLESIELPEDVHSIGDNAFNACYSLTSIVMPEKLQTIGQYAFANTGLTSISIPKTVTDIGERAFHNSKLESVTFLGGCKIPQGCFFDCKYLTDIDLGSCTSLGNDAFHTNTSLTSVTIPAAMTSIYETAFRYDTNLTEYKVEEGNNYFSVSGGVLYNKSKTTVYLYPAGKTSSSYTIASTVTRVNNCCFESAANLKTVTLPDKLAYIGPYAFAYSGLTSVTIPATVTGYGNDCFRQCASLTKVVMSGAGASSLPNDMFLYCTALTSVTLPKNLEKINWYVFKNCSALASISLPSKLTEIGYQSFYSSGLTSITIPASVDTLGAGAFRACLSLQKVVFASGSGVVTLPKEIFYGATKLTSVTLPAGLQKIGEYAFYFGGFTSISLPSGLCVIDNRAFSGANLTSVTIPATVSSLGSYAFYSFTLKTAKFLGDVPYFYSNTFYNTTTLSTPSSTAWTTAKKNRYNYTVTNPKVDISKCKFKLSSTTLVYTGKALTPTVTVTSGTTKLPTYCYKLTWKSNTNPGTAYVTVTGLNGNYGSKKLSFCINPKGTALSSLTAGKKCFTAKWKKQATKTNGYQIQYSTSSKFASPKLVKITSNKTVSKKISSLKAKKKYYVRIRTFIKVGIVYYYSAWSAAKAVTAK